MKIRVPVQPYLHGNGQWAMGNGQWAMASSTPLTPHTKHSEHGKLIASPN